MKFHIAHVVLMFAMILIAVQAKDVQKTEMLGFSEFLYGVFDTAPKYHHLT